MTSLISFILIISFLIFIHELGHLLAAKWANEKLGTKITHQDNPYLFYIKSNCEDDIKIKERQKAICLN